MTRSISRRLLVAGATATALLTLSVFSGSANASTAPATSAAAAASCPDAAGRTFGLIFNNACVEYIAGFKGLTANQVTLVRGLTLSQAFTDFIFSGGRKNFSVAVLDYGGNTIKQYNFRSAQAIRYTGGEVMFQFQEVLVS